MRAMALAVGNLPTSDEASSDCTSDPMSALSEGEIENMDDAAANFDAEYDEEEEEDGRRWKKKKKK
eukprot:m.110507 g.110507  ORF g.110507 m.110507 type:complete len:66 (+) comp28047_c4_seq1:271-468(+)